MRVFTLHGPLAAPERWVLVPEAFAWGGLVFGPFWLLRHRLFRETALWLVLFFLLVLLTPRLTGINALAPAFALSSWWAVGLFGHDLRRGALARRGFPCAAVIAARNREEALMRAMSACRGEGREAAALA